MSAVTAAAPLEFLLNGRAVRVDAPAPQTMLLDYLRAQGLTGAKEGCAEGECGACAVLMVGSDGDGSAYRPVNSCLMFLPMAASREIYTVESLAAHGELSEVQRAMAAAGGSQCGYCTPGFVMSLFAEQYRPGRQGPCDPLVDGRQSLPMYGLSADPGRGARARPRSARALPRPSRSTCPAARPRQY